MNSETMQQQLHLSSAFLPKLYAIDMQFPLSPTVECPQGTEWRFDVAACVVCDVGFFADAGACLPCPPGHTTLRSGAKYLQACKPHAEMELVRKRILTHPGTVMAEVEKSHSFRVPEMFINQP